MLILTAAILALVAMPLDVHAAVDPDADSDGYPLTNDCDDGNSAINPGATEVCNGLDDNCDGTIDEGVQTTFYRDADLDTYGSPGTTILACSAPAGHVADATDCDDANSAVHPGATELCNDVDDNCSDTIDEELSQPTTCGAGVCAGNAGTETCAAGVWGGNTCGPFAGATVEILDRLDNNCDGTVDEGLNPPGITVTPTSGLVTTEAGRKRFFTVRLAILPSADVTVALTSSDATEGTVSPASLSFTAANWNRPQTVTVTGVDDQVDDGDVLYTIRTAALSEDANYAGLEGAAVSLTNADNDTAGITVAPTAGLVTTEAGGWRTFTVKLRSLPTADVTIDLASSDTTEGAVSPASLVFTPVNALAAQTVTVTGVDDQADDGNVAYRIVTAAAVSADLGYDGRNPADVSASNTDDDTAGFTVVPTSGLITTEAGGQASFTVRLNTVPTAGVTIALSSNDTTEGAVSPSGLTFTAEDWSEPRIVAVTGADDRVVDGIVKYRIVTAAAVSADPRYNGRNPADVWASNIDDDTAGFTVTPTSGLFTTEAGGQASFTVRLNTLPTRNVTIAISSSDPAEGAVVPPSNRLTFTAANALTAQTVIVRGVDDSSVDGNTVYTISTATASSADANYNGLNPADIEVTNVDDETPGFTITPVSGLVTTEDGGTAEFTVALTSAPTADVRIFLSSDDDSEGTVEPSSLTFTSTNWSEPQTVTVAGLDDEVLDGNILYAILTAAAESEDVRYNGLDPLDVPVTNQELPEQPAVATITANDADDSYELVPGEPLRVDVWLECGSYCDAWSEVWISAVTPAGTRYYDGSSEGEAWGSAALPSFTGELGAIAGLRVLDEPTPPPGSSSYTISVFLLEEEGAALIASDTVTVGSAAGFFEDFEDGVADDWSVDADPGWVVGDGVFRVSPRGTTTASTSVRFASYPVSYADFTYGADLRLSESPGSPDGFRRGVGLLFRSDGTYRNGYVFHINANGSFTIFKRAGGATTTLVPWTTSPAECTGEGDLTFSSTGSTICTGAGAWNRLEVTALGRDMIFRVNGTTVAAVRESAGASRMTGRPGLKVFGGNDAREIFEFDNVQLRVPR